MDDAGLDFATSTVDSLVLALGPAGAVLLLAGAALFILVKRGHVRVGGPEQPAADGAADTPLCGTCPAQHRLTATIERLEEAVARSEEAMSRLEIDVAKIDQDVSLHHRILVSPDHGSRSVIDRLVGVEEAMTRIEALLVRALEGSSADST